MCSSERGLWQSFGVLGRGSKVLGRDANVDATRSHQEDPELPASRVCVTHGAGLHILLVLHVYCSKKGNILTMSSLSGCDGGTNTTLLAGTLVVGVQGFSFWPIISHAPQTRKRCIACSPSLKPTAAL